MKKKVIFILVIILSACEGDIYTPDPFDISVEGFIEQGKSPFVTLMRSLPVNTEYESLDSLSKYAIKDAVVKVTVDAKVYDLEIEQSGLVDTPYLYTSHELIGEEGKKYLLDIYYMDRHLSAVTTIPKPINILSIEPTQMDNSPESYMVTASFIDDKSTRDYYKTFVSMSNVNNTYLSSFMGNFDDSDFTTDTINISILKGRTFHDDNFMPMFNKGDSVFVKFCHIEEKAYHYWNEYEKTLFLSRNPIFSVRKNLPSNIEGGLGYWFGYGSTIYNFIIR